MVFRSFRRKGAAHSSEPILTRVEHGPVPPVQLQRELDDGKEAGGEREEVGEEDEVEPPVEALLGVGVVDAVAELAGPRAGHVHRRPGSDGRRKKTVRLAERA